MCSLLLLPIYLDILRFFIIPMVKQVLCIILSLQPSTLRIDNTLLWRASNYALVLLSKCSSRLFKIIIGWSVHLLSCFLSCIDTIAGKVKRAPEAWCRYNLEWLYRLIHDPRRIGRQKVLPLFVALVMREKLKLKLKSLIDLE